MHRTTGADYVLESGYRRWIDQNLPGVPGTVMYAEFCNMLQEEFANVLDYAGMTPALNPTSDRLAGWHQIRDAIFNSEALTTAAVNSIDLSKLFGTLQTTRAVGGGTFDRELSDEQLLLSHNESGGDSNLIKAEIDTPLLRLFQVSSGVTELAELSTTKLVFDELVVGGPSEFGNEGMKFGPGTQKVKFSIVDLSDRPTDWFEYDLDPPHPPYAVCQNAPTLILNTKTIFGYRLVIEEDGPAVFENGYISRKVSTNPGSSALSLFNDYFFLSINREAGPYYQVHIKSERLELLNPTLVPSIKLMIWHD